MKINILIFILYFNFIIQVLGNNKVKVSNCERYIRYYLQNNNYSIQEHCYIDNLNPKPKCYAINKIDIIEVCKKDLLEWYKSLINNTFNIENPMKK